MKERLIEKNAPEQGLGQFPAQAATDGGNGWFPAFMSELPSSVSSTCGTRHPAVRPLGDRDGGRHPDIAQALVLMHPCTQ